MENIEIEYDDHSPENLEEQINDPTDNNSSIDADENVVCIQENEEYEDRSDSSDDLELDYKKM
jgi:hypothetical protein